MNLSSNVCMFVLNHAKNLPESNPSSHIKNSPISALDPPKLANEKLRLWQSCSLSVVRIVLAGCWHYNKESLVQGGAVTDTEKPQA